jgi:hypothetical protein
VKFESEFGELNVASALHNGCVLCFFSLEQAFYSCRESLKLQGLRKLVYDDSASKIRAMPIRI